MINLVLRNLIGNAIKFTNINGTINIGSYTDKNYIFIYVKDNGIGIEKINIDKFIYT